MKQYLSIILIYFICLVSCVNQPSAATEGKGSTIPVIPTAGILQPKLLVNQEKTGPSQQILIEGSRFPANQIIVIYYADSEVNLGPAVAQAVSSEKGEFTLELLTPTAWPGADFRGETRLLVVAEAVDSAQMASAAIVIEYEDALALYENSTFGYSVEIPIDWGTTDPQITPLGELVLIGPEPIVPGNPSNSMIISVNATQLDKAAAAQSLICGSPNCAGDVTFTITTVNGLDARSLVVGGENTPDIEWFFVRYEDRLIYFTLHDPLTLETIDGLVQSFSLTDQVASESASAVSSIVESTEEPTVAATETPANTPTVESTATATQTLSIDPTETLSPTLTPTETVEPTQTLTETPTSTPSPTLIPTNTATPSSTPTSTSTSTPSVTDASTAVSDPDGTNTSVIGPLQTSIELLTILSAQSEGADTLEYFTQAASAEIDVPSSILAFMQLDSEPISFQVERLVGIPTVRVQVKTRLGLSIEIDLLFVLENGLWRIDSVSIIEDIAATEQAIETEEAAATEGPVTTEEAASTEEPTVTEEASG